MILVFDPFNGISGDMTVGALIDAGLPLELVRETYDRLAVPGLQAEAEPAVRAGIRGTKFRVRCDQERSHRHLSQIRTLIGSAGLAERARELALAVFTRLAEAEAEVHGTTAEKVHFHEVGALDSIADIVGAAVGFDYFKVNRFFTNPINVGYGMISCDHGLLPVPAPATALMLRRFATFRGTIESEMTTPTGAAIVSALAEPLPASLSVVRRTLGYGAGDRDFTGTPNFLRIFLAEEEPDLRGKEDILEIQVNIDDMNPQLYGPLLHGLMAAGALDAFYQPVVMKQGRPGILLTILCEPQQRERVASLLFRETTTLGIRYETKRREILNRTSVVVKTAYGEVRIKVAERAGEILNYAAEFEDCQKLAQRAGVPIKEVYQAAMAGYRRRHEDQ